MSLRQLSLTDFRNLHSTTIDFDPDLNIICGSNASGKTSLLEAIHIISQGRSFRTSKLDDCIQHGKEQFLVFAYNNKHKAGLRRTNKETKIRIDGETVNKLSHLAELSPIKTINADCIELVIGSPGIKREFIDWCLFHVEHEYHSKWLLFNHALKQRNAILRNKKNLEQLDYWDEYLIRFSIPIYELRKKYFNLLSDSLDKEVAGLIKDLHIRMDYKPGWNIEKPLIELYRQQRNTDIKYGYTQYGIHRDSFELYSSKHSVKQELSRGQQKRLSIALTLVQINLVKKLTGKPVILLVDDLHAELDKSAMDNILKIIKSLGLQVFITSIEMEQSLSTYYQEYKMFHVEHGIITPVENH